MQKNAEQEIKVDNSKNTSVMKRLLYGIGGLGIAAIYSYATMEKGGDTTLKTNDTIGETPSICDNLFDDNRLQLLSGTKDFNPDDVCNDLVNIYKEGGPQKAVLDHTDVNFLYGTNVVDAARYYPGSNQIVVPVDPVGPRSDIKITHPFDYLRHEMVHAFDNELGGSINPTKNQYLTPEEQSQFGKDINECFKVVSQSPCSKTVVKAFAKDKSYHYIFIGGLDKIYESKISKHIIIGEKKITIEPTQIVKRNGKYYYKTNDVDLLCAHFSSSVMQGFEHSIKSSTSQHFDPKDLEFAEKHAYTATFPNNVLEKVCPKMTKMHEKIISRVEAKNTAKYKSPNPYDGLRDL